MNYTNYINGEFGSSAEEYLFTRTSPSDFNDFIGAFVSGKNDIDIACEVARNAFNGWKNTNLSERINFIQRLDIEYKNHKELLARTISRETGKPLWESNIEVDALSSKIKATLEIALQHIQPSQPIMVLQNVEGKIEYRPKGVVAVIGPFNFPAHIPNGMFVSALLAGNVVIFKPSPHTPLTAHILAEIINKVGFPKGVFQVVHGESAAGSYLSDHVGIDLVLFTGSYQAGQQIKKNTLDQNWKSLALEMGGKNVALVWEDADIDLAVKECTQGAYQTTGQRCSSTSRIALHPKISDPFISKFLEETKKIHIGHWSDDIYMGPLISKEAKESFFSFEQNFLGGDIEVLLKSREIEIQQWKGNYVSPRITMAKKIDSENLYHQEEVFGPDVCFFLCESIAELKNITSLGGYGLTLSIFSTNSEIVDLCKTECRIGNIHWNMATNWASAKLPFGGYGKSGNERFAGSSLIHSCVEQFVYLQSH